MMQNQGQRSADKVMCIEFWKVLLSAPSLEWSSPAFKWRDEWIEFVTNHKSIKTVSRDQWNHVLKFARLSLADPTLGFHNEEQSWPSVIDEFVDHVKALQGGAKAAGEEMEF
jgi:DCN1-like protein 1/2